MTVDDRSLLPLVLHDTCFSADGRRLVSSVSAQVAGAGVTVLLGPNGAGKTLLLRMCRGLLTPTAGLIQWNEQSPRSVGCRVGYVPQHPAMLRRSVHANLVYAVRWSGAPSPQRNERIEEGLELSGLSNLQRAPARLLSGGERQRLAIARAWVQRPRVLMLDEPSAHLDPAAAAAVERTIASIRDAGTKVILTTHDLHQAQRLAEEVLFLHDGRLVEQGPAEAFFSQPTTREAATFLAGGLLAA